MTPSSDSKPDIHKRVSRRIENFLWNRKSADRVAAEILQMIAEHNRSSTTSDLGGE